MVLFVACPPEALANVEEEDMLILLKYSQLIMLLLIGQDYHQPKELKLLMPGVPNKISLLLKLKLKFTQIHWIMKIPMLLYQNIWMTATCMTIKKNSQNVGAVTVTTDLNTAPGIQENAGDQFGQRSRQRFPDQSRYIGMFRSFHRTTVQENTKVTISQMDAIMESTEQYQESFIELDSHADTSCIGANCRIIAYTDKVCSVSPFHPKYKAMDNIPVVQAGTAYDDLDTGKTYILILNQSLYMGDALPSTLLNLNQARSNNIVVDDVLHQF